MELYSTQRLAVRNSYELCDPQTVINNLSRCAKKVHDQVKCCFFQIDLGAYGHYWFVIHYKDAMCIFQASAMCGTPFFICVACILIGGARTWNLHTCWSRLSANHCYSCRASVPSNTSRFCLPHP